jgi:hypothetical protein
VPPLAGTLGDLDPCFGVARSACGIFAARVFVLGRALGGSVKLFYLMAYGACCVLEFLAQWGKERLSAKLKAPPEAPT